MSSKFFCGLVTFFIGMMLLLTDIIAQVPVISSFSPTSGGVGTTVTITGSNFGATSADNIVYFGNTKAVISSASSTSITVAIPLGVTYPPHISVLNTTSDLSAISKQPFYITFSGLLSVNGRANIPTGNGTGSGSAPESVCIGDLDGDSLPDLVTANSGSNNISVLRNTSTPGTVSFSKTDFGTNTSPKSISIGDIDGDGKLDLLVSNSGSNNFSIFRNTSSVGAISFAIKIDFATGGNPISIKVGDLNQDGKPDVAVVNNGNSNVSVYKNNSTVGSISLDTKVDFTTGSLPISVDIGDLDGDNLPDLAIAVTDSVSFIKNSTSAGSISFANKKNYFVGTSASPNFIKIGDLNGDAVNDMIVANKGATFNNISVFVNSSSTPGTFVKTNYTTGTAPSSIEIADLDGDGKPDLSVTNLSSKTISFFKNTSTMGAASASFGVRADTATGTNPTSVCVGDLDKDGKPDLAVSNKASSTVSVFLNNPSPIITSFSPTNGTVGTTVTISGTNFLGSTAVSFGGTAVASFLVNSSNSISAVLSTGSTGKISITTSLGTGISSANFTYVTPPIQYNVTGGGSYCSGNSGVLVGLDGSELGVNYQLKNGTSNVGAVVAGTGNALNFGYQTAAGTYTVEAINATNSSIFSTMFGNAIIVVKSTSSSSFVVTICDSYAWNDSVYTTSGIKTYTTVNAIGCDSIATLNLTIKKSSSSETTITACSSYTWFGTTYTTSGFYTRTGFINKAGCDSIAILNLTINQPTSSTSNVTACSSYTWNGITYTTSGIKIYTTLNLAGCDSTATLNLTINQPSNSNSTVTQCTPYTWNGLTYSKSGVYSIVLINKNGCDSTATLNYTNNSSSLDTTAIVCGSSFVWYGTTYNSSGVYVKSGMKNKKNCDSIATLNLTLDTYKINSANIVSDLGVPLCSGSLLNFEAQIDTAGVGINGHELYYKWTVLTYNLLDSLGSFMDSTYLQQNVIKTTAVNESSLNNQVKVRLDFSTNDPCTSVVTDSVLINLEPLGIWNKSISNFWSDGDNWSCGLIPTTVINATISASDSVLIIDSESLFVKNLNLNGTLIFTDSIVPSTLEVHGNWQNAGLFLPGNGTVIFADTNQIIDASGKSNKTENFNNLTIEQSTSIAANTKVDLLTKGTLVVNGQFDLNHQKMILNSDENSTARVAELSSDSAFLNAENFTMERYFSKHRRVRYISSPVISPAIKQLKDSTRIMGPSAGGFDSPFNSTTSIKRYKEASTLSINSSWLSESSINNTLVSGLGYYLFGTGKRSTVFPDSSEVTLALRGVPHTGTISFPVTYSDPGTKGWNLVGNPYPSQISWNSSGWNKSNINDAIYLWDPLKGKTGDYYSYVNGISSDGRENGEIIPSFQGFFVKANAANPVLEVMESAKANSVHTANFRKEERDIIRLKVNYGNSSDQTVLYFQEGATKKMDPQFDALKLSTGDISVYTSSDENYSINSLPATSDTFSVSLRVITKFNGNHQITVPEFNSGISNTIYLIDNLTNKATEINTDFVYPFFAVVNGPSRFKIANFIPKQMVTNLNNGTEQNALLVYPNPTIGELNIQTESENDKLKSIEIYSIDGILLLKHENINSYSFKTTEFETYNSGMYLIKVVSDKLKFQKLITKQ